MKANVLLDQIFLESRFDEADASLKKLAKEPKDANKSATPETLAKKEKELVSILKELGVEDPGKRVSIKYGAFRLETDCYEQHKADMAILNDLSKISPLIDAGFVALDAEENEEGKHSVTLLAADVEPDPDLDGLGGVSDPDEVEESTAEVAPEGIADRLIEGIFSSMEEGS